MSDAYEEAPYCVQSQREGLDHSLLYSFRNPHLVACDFLFELFDQAVQGTDRQLAGTRSVAKKRSTKCVKPSSSTT